ncbi:hypothetical protein TWF225_007182 [Orbilia oligospora]|uniref:Uncharacterized protein n=1 Tax=Orbilia oligospora TaxID=2813651 RepID=A0A7C8P9K1_ORBOL|nr:hypothetical protein TWF751_009945 [Orbilia oligospora]KAF3180821.1 hypothetical protein TWF225_007182 [Orbilia oligospora]KAF3233963.1 hypothetical protein TWF217_004396 [Orbilia oligospora]KAF3236581.1 hypothetical protein TWF128_001315 [Orbilia oligospora]KAF3287221.1 hypothetical protein TWF132_008592 [Orbilia oligospora]
MVQNPKSLVLRTDITSRPEEQEHNPRSRPQSPALLPPPLSPLPSIEVTAPTGETASVAPPTFDRSPTSPSNNNNNNEPANWKEREAEFDRQFCFPPRNPGDYFPPANMPSHPPPAYTSTTTPTSPTLTNRQRRLGLPKLNSSHTRVSSVNPSKSPIDGRRWHEKRRNIASVIGLSLVLLLIALLLNFCYILPGIRRPNEEVIDESDVVLTSDMLAGHWNMTTARLETVSAEDTTVVDMCSSKESEFERCVDSRFLALGAGEKYTFDLDMNPDGTFTGIFSEGIFSQTGKTEVKLTPSRYGLMSSWVYPTDDIEGKLSTEGCFYQRPAIVRVTFEDGVATYTITEKQMVSSGPTCSLPQGRRSDYCQCVFIGTRPKTRKNRR